MISFLSSPTWQLHGIIGYKQFDDVYPLMELLVGPGRPKKRIGGWDHKTNKHAELVKFTLKFYDYK